MSAHTGTDDIPGDQPGSTGSAYTFSTQTGPLTSAHLQALSLASQRSRRMMTAARVATFNGWTIALCAAICLPFAILDASAFFIALCLGAVAFVELRGATMLRANDLRAPRMLGINQLVLLSLVLIYCSLSIYRGLTGPDLSEQLMSEHPELDGALERLDEPDMKSMIGSLGAIHRTLVVTVYGSVIFASLLFQGLCAMYYFTRKKHMQAYINETPAWVQEVQRRMS